MTPGRLSLNCRDADERGDEAHVCVGCGCLCHDAPVEGPGTRLAGPGALRDAYRAVRAGQEPHVPVQRAGE